MTPKKSAIVATLKSTQLFSALNSSEIGSFAERTSIRRFAPGELLFAEGEPCAGLFVVISGRVRIFKTSPSGREQVLTIEGPGGSIAELPVFDGGPASRIPLRPPLSMNRNFSSFRALISVRAAWSTPKFR